MEERKGLGKIRIALICALGVLIIGCLSLFGGLTANAAEADYSGGPFTICDIKNNGSTYSVEAYFKGSTNPLIKTVDGVQYFNRNPYKIVYSCDLSSSLTSGGVSGDTLEISFCNFYQMAYIGALDGFAYNNIELTIDWDVGGAYYINYYSYYYTGAVANPWGGKKVENYWVNTFEVDNDEYLVYYGDVYDSSGNVLNISEEVQSHYKLGLLFYHYPQIVELNGITTYTTPLIGVIGVVPPNDNEGRTCWGHIKSISVKNTSTGKSTILLENVNTEESNVHTYIIGKTSDSKMQSLISSPIPNGTYELSYESYEYKSSNKTNGSYNVQHEQTGIVKFSIRASVVPDNSLLISDSISISSLPGTSGTTPSLYYGFDSSSYTYTGSATNEWFTWDSKPQYLYLVVPFDNFITSGGVDTENGICAWVSKVTTTDPSTGNTETNSYTCPNSFTKFTYSSDYIQISLPINITPGLQYGLEVSYYYGQTDSMSATNANNGAMVFDITSSSKSFTFKCGASTDSYEVKDDGNGTRSLIVTYETPTKTDVSFEATIEGADFKNNGAWLDSVSTSAVSYTSMSGGGYTAIVTYSNIPNAVSTDATVPAKVGWEINSGYGADGDVDIYNKYTEYLLKDENGNASVSAGGGEVYTFYLIFEEKPATNATSTTLMSGVYLDVSPIGFVLKISDVQNSSVTTFKSPAISATYAGSSSSTTIQNASSQSLTSTVTGSCSYYYYNYNLSANDHSKDGTFQVVFGSLSNGTSTLGNFTFTYVVDTIAPVLSNVPEASWYKSFDTSFSDSSPTTVYYIDENGEQTNVVISATSDSIFIEFKKSGIYNYYFEDAAGNTTHFEIWLDVDKPTALVDVNTTTVHGVEYINDNKVTVTVSDATSGVAQIVAIWNDVDGYMVVDTIDGINTYEITLDQPGTWTFYAVDRAGNKSSQYDQYNCPHGDDEGSFVTMVENEATCEENGSYIYTCEVCGSTWEVPILATGHKYEVDVSASGYVEATCGDGVDVYVCEYCGDSYTVITGGSGEHTWDAGKVLKEPTCAKEGEILYTCTVCGATEPGVLDCTDDHSPEKSDELSVEPTCEDAGKYVYVCSVCGKETSSVEIAAKGHKYEDCVVAPTCTEDGYTVHECSVCGYSYPINYVDAAGHVWNSGVETTPPTEYEKGLMTYTCIVCGEEKTEDIAATGVCSMIYVETIAPTCTDKGYDVYECVYCGYIDYDNFTDALGHTASRKLGRASTCTEDGYWTVTCSVCEAELDPEIIPASGHEWDTVCCYSCYGTDRRCIVCECEEHIAGDGIHDYGIVDYLNPTCTMEGFESYICAICGDEYTITVAIEDHVMKKTADRAEGDCSYEIWECLNCGYTEHRSAGDDNHLWVDMGCTATCTEDGVQAYVCSNCGAVKTEDVAAYGHSYTVKRSDLCIAASCECEGLDVYECTRCGDFLYEVVNATGHSYKSVVIDPSCTEMGYTTYTCSVCGDSYRDDYTDALGHNYKGTTKSATCTDGGYTDYACARCGDSYRDDYTEALGHSWDAGTVTIAPTEFDGGTMTYTCARCGETYAEGIPATGEHEYVLTDSLSATCTESGYKTYECKYCDASYTTYEDALGHSYSSTEKVATCTDMGYTLHTCTRCGDSYKDGYTDALGHSYDAISVPATQCGDQGYTLHTCTRCGSSYKDEYTESLGHDFEKVETAPTCTEEGRIEYICARCGEHAALSVTIPATGHDMVAIETDDSIYHVCDNGCGYYYKEDKNSDDAKGGIGGGSGSGSESGDDESGSGSAGGSSSSDNEYIENKPNYVPITPSQNGGYVYSSFDVKSGKIVRDESLGVAFTWEDSTLCATVTYADDPYTFIPYDNGDWLKTETEYTFILYSPLYDSKDSCVYGTDYYCYVVTLSHSWTDWTYTAGDCTHGGTEERYCRYCGSTQTENVAATGHSYTVTETCEATCTESGHITSLCSKCGSVKEETIAPLGHSFVTYTVDPTCQHGGYWLQWCPICETLGSWLQLTDSVGHTYELKLTDVIPYDHDDGEIPEYCYRVYYNYECTMCDSECEDHFMMTYVDVSHDFCLDYEEEITILNEDGSEDIQLLKVYACSVCAVSFEELSFEKGFAATVVEWFESNQSYIWWLFLVFALAWAIFLGIKYAMSRGDGETAVARKAVADFVLGLLVIALICVCVPYLIYGIAAVVI